MKIIINWFLFLSFVAAVVVLVWHRHWIGEQIPERGTMTGPQVLFFALACAFTWVEVLKWGVVKPFNCLKCMTGWFAVILAFMFHVEFWPMYLPAGLFVGAIISAIQMRYL